MSTFDESLHPRDNGKFTEKPGSEPAVALIQDTPPAPSRLTAAYAALEVARAECLAAQMEESVTVIDKYVPDAVGVKVMDSDASPYWLLKRPGDERWRSVYDFDEDEDGINGDELYDALGDVGWLDMNNPGDLQDYCVGSAPTNTGWGYPDSMEVDKHTGRVESIELDLDLMRRGGIHAPPVPVS